MVPGPRSRVPGKAGQTRISMTRTTVTRDWGPGTGDGDESLTAPPLHFK